MGKFVILSLMISAVTVNANSQTFMQHLQEQKNGQGKVTVIQSKEIDELVNGKTYTNGTTISNSGKEGTIKNKATATNTHDIDNNTSSTNTDADNKASHKNYKINGYRVQVYAGGNSRNDKLKAQQAGNSIKKAFPEQPIYVHFYSPRWICRMGNFRSYEEANNMLREVQRLGFDEACIVSGKIVVPYQ